MIEVSAEVSKSDINNIKQRLGRFEDKAPTVLSRAINRTVASVKTDIKRQVTKKYVISSTNVGATLKDVKANKNKLSGHVTSTGAVIPLGKFKVTPQKVVTYRDGEPNPTHYSTSVFRKESPKPLVHDPKAFVAVMKNGHGGVFERVWGKKSKVNPNKEVIQQRFGPSVPQMIKNADVIDIIKNKAESTLSKRIDAEINYILSKGGG